MNFGDRDITVSVRGVGGLANKLFQVAAATAVAQKVGGRVVLSRNKWVEAGPKYQRAHNDIDEVFGAIEKVNNISATRTFRENMDETSNMYDKPLFETINIHLIRPGDIVLLYGFFQNPQHLTDIGSIFVPILRLPRVPMHANTAFIHVRLGDYVGSRAWSFDLSIYYARAAAALLHTRPETNIMLFTDGKASDAILRRYIRSMRIQPERLTIRSGGDPYVCLQEMRGCEWGGICGPSTFSWWAAWLSNFDSSYGKRFFFPNIFANTIEIPIVHAKYVFSDIITVVPVW